MEIVVLKDYFNNEYFGDLYKDICGMFMEDKIMIVLFKVFDDILVKVLYN